MDLRKLIKNATWCPSPLTTPLASAAAGIVGEIALADHVDTSWGIVRLDSFHFLTSDTFHMLNQWEICFILECMEDCYDLLELLSIHIIIKTYGQAVKSIAVCVY